MLNCGIVGLTLSGKSTVFNVITRAGAEVKPYAGGKTDPNRAVVSVPDARFDKLVEIYQPKKITPAPVEFVDLAGLSRDASKGAGLGNSFLSFVAESEALIHVVRCFDNPDVPHPEDTVDPLRDWNIVETELILRDLSVIENRLKKLHDKKKPSPEEQAENTLLERCRDHLFEELPLREMTFSPDETRVIRGFTFLTLKPELVVLNLDETQADASLLPWLAGMEKLASNRGLGLVRLFGRMEMEIADLAPDEQAEFLSELGISEPGRERLIREAYSLLGLIYFFTVGKEEVKAWTIREKNTAVEAAGAIHSDLARGFIRAQVVHYVDFEGNGFSNAKCREKGLLRLEGKEYLVKDGDIIEIRFNV
ncbi:MAG: redox-regulated ATPase YchF [Thermovirgaceae bacterium]|nr:redox-regulated ATPase YchF [Thermovirgaceae bacterium]